jgi:hypothetical protein
MSPAAVIQVLEGLMPALSQAADPSDVLVKYAGERKLAPAQLEKLAQFYNTYQAVHTLDNGPSRDSLYPILDVAKTLEKYASFTPVTAQAAAAAMPEESLHTHHTCDSLADFLSASSGDWKSRGVIELRKAASAETPAVAPELKPVDMLKLAELEVDLERAYTHTLRKIANALYQEPRSAQLLVEDIERFRKDACITSESLLGQVRRIVAIHELAGVEKRAGVARLERDRTGFLSIFDDLNEIQGALNAAGEIRKWATQAPPKPGQSTKMRGHTSNNPTGGGGTGTGSKGRAGELPTLNIPGIESDPEQFALSSLSAADPAPTAGEPAISAAQIDAAGKELGGQFQDATSNTAIERYLSGWAKSLIPTRNKDQEKVDSSIDNERAQLILTKLMVTDPVLKNADPERVASFATTIARTDPAILQDPNLLRFILREAVQYDGIPPQTVSDLAKTRETQLRGDASARDAAKDKYSLKPVLADGKKEDKK